MDALPSAYSDLVLSDDESVHLSSCHHGVFRVFSEKAVVAFCIGVGLGFSYEAIYSVERRLMVESLGPEDTHGEGMGGPEIGSRRVIHVPPSLEVIEQLSRAICQRLAVANPMLDFEKITREFSAFLSVLARMHANRLNRSTSLDSEGQSE